MAALPSLRQEGSWAATRATRPAVVCPGAADEPATDDDGADQRQPEFDHQPAALGAPAQLAVLVGPGVGVGSGRGAVSPFRATRFPGPHLRTGRASSPA